MNRTIEINGKTFEQVSENVTIPHTTGNIRRYSDVYQAYKRPSTYKVDIWSAWREWFDRTFPVMKFYDRFFMIESANCFTFTIVGCACDSHFSYRFYITKEHARVSIKHN